MWTWKCAIVMIFLCIIAVSFFVDVSILWKSPKNETFKCLNPTGDGSIICHFTEDVKLKDRLNITKIAAIQNATIGEIRLTSIVAIHRMNMPENLPGEFYKLKLIKKIIFVIFKAELD